MTGVQPPRSGNSAPLTAPADLLRCADGDIIVSAYLPEHWIAFTDAIGAPELRDEPRFGNSVSRARHREAFVALIEERLRAATVAEWLTRLQLAGVLASRVKDYPEVLADPLTTESGAVLTGDPVFGVRNPVDLVDAARTDAWQRVELDPAQIESVW